MMNDEYLDKYLPVIAFDVAIEEKIKIAKIAAATLHKLHNVMQQMKDWRDDSAKLKSNIWRMKMALRVDNENGNDNQQIIPLIVHQRAEISRLEQANDVLENEVTNLRRTLTKAKEDIVGISVCEIGNKITRLEDRFLSEKERLNNDEILCVSTKQLKEAENSFETSVALNQLKDKLREFAIGDRTIEAVFANAIGKIVETVVALSEELVNVNEDLYRFKAKNRNLHRKLDRLRAMLRSRCGSSAEYRKRIYELNYLAQQLMGEMGRLKVIRENANNVSESFDATDIPDIIGHMERLMNDLRNNLKSDREAIIAAGDPDCLRYMKKVVDLRVNLKVLFVELRRSNASVDEQSTRDNTRYDKYLETASLLNNFLKELDTEIGKLKVKPMDKYCKIGGFSGSQYMTKIVELEDIVRKSAAVIAVVKQSPLGMINVNETTMKELENLIERMCCKMKDLELFDDRASLRERIDQLETSVAHLKLELAEKKKRENALNGECESVRSTLDCDRKKYQRIIAVIREESDSLREDIMKQEQEISTLSRERKHSERRVAEVQVMKNEIDAVRQKLQDLHNDKEALLEEAEEMRNILRERDKEIENIITQRNALAGILGIEVEELRMKLGIASDENVKLKSIIEVFGKQKVLPDKLEREEKKNSRDNGERYSRNYPRNQSTDESGRLEAKKSTGSEISSNEAYNKQTDHLKRVLDIDTTQTDVIANLESNEQLFSVASQEFETTILLKASEKQTSFWDEKERQLETKLPKLRPEDGLEKKSMADDDVNNNKYAALQDQVKKRHVTSDEGKDFREKMSGREAVAENFMLELERTQAELEDAGIEMARLRAENSRIVGDLDTLSIRHTETEDRVRVLLTEKNELATRINELDDESVALQEQLNQARAENEYLFMEMNKSRVTNDEARAQNVLLRAICNERERDIDELKRERDGTSVDRMFGGDLRVQHAKYASHGKDNDQCRNHLKKIDARDQPEKDVREFTDVRNEITHKQDCSDATRTNIKVEIGERRDGETELKVESDTCTGYDNKAKIKDTPKDEVKSSGAENKALKLERANLRSENSGITIELARTKDGFEDSPPERNFWTNDEEIIDSRLRKFQIVNISHGKKMNDYSDDYLKTFENKSGYSTMVDIDQLVAENRTLKEVNVPCDSLDSGRTNSKKTKIDLRTATDEIQALKLELINLRNEKTALKSRFKMFKEELNELKSERTALKNELVASRKSNFDLRLKANDLRCTNERLKETNAGLQSRLQDALAWINEYITVLDERFKNNVESALNSDLKKYNLAKKNLRAINKRLNRNECVLPKSLGSQSVEENLQYMEGHK